MNIANVSLLRFLAAIIVILAHNRADSEFLKVAPSILIAIVPLLGNCGQVKPATVLLKEAGLP